VPDRAGSSPANAGFEAVSVTPSYLHSRREVTAIGCNPTQPFTEGTVTLPGGATVPMSALRLAWALEARGVSLALGRAGSLIVQPMEMLTEVDREAIEEWKSALVTLVACRQRGASSDVGWLTVREAAARARCGPKLIYREVSARRLRAAVIGGRRALRFRDAWIDDWLESQAPHEVRHDDKGR